MIKFTENIDSIFENELFWVFFQTFSEKLFPLKDLEKEKVKYFATKFNLSARIGGKYSNFNQPNNDFIIKHFLDNFKENQKKNLINLSACSKLLNLSKNFGISIIFLKGAHLLLANKIKLGYRSFADIDILVKEEEALKFFNFLSENGFKSFQSTDKALHLPVLYDNLCGVEIHKKIPFLKLKGEKEFINYNQIEKNLAIDFVEENGERFFVLSEKYLIAHLLVHSLFQHYYSPHLYPFMRFFTDISDLNLSNKNWEENIDFVFDNFDIPFEKEKAMSAIEIISFFKKGEKEEIVNLSYYAKELFIHLIRGTLDSSYCYSLRLKAIKNRYFFDKGIKKWKDILRDEIWISPYQISNLYTKPKNALHLFFLRLYHIIKIIYKTLKVLFIKFFK